MDNYLGSNSHFYVDVWILALIIELLNRVAYGRRYILFREFVRLMKGGFLLGRCLRVGRNCNGLRRSFHIAKGILRILGLRSTVRLSRRNVSTGFWSLWTLLCLSIECRGLCRFPDHLFFRPKNIHIQTILKLSSNRRDYTAFLCIQELIS